MRPAGAVSKPVAASETRPRAWQSGSLADRAGPPGPEDRISKTDHGKIIDK